MRSAWEGAARLHLALRIQGGTVAENLGPLPDGDATHAPGPAQVAASGPRAAGRENEYELLLEMILEGSRLHYGEGLVVRPGDIDLALLLGDQLYALGLSRLAALGDVAAVAELADVISLVAQAQANSDPELARAIWDAGAVAVGWGPSEAHQTAKSLARRGDCEAEQALCAVAEAARRVVR